MSLNDTLSNVLSQVLNCEKVGKKSCNTKNSSKLIKDVLSILKEKKYILDFEVKETSKGEELKVLLSGNINKCGTIKPRFSVKKEGFKKFEKRYLPAKDFGVIIVSTPKGLMTHNKAVEKNTGGKLICYCY